MQYRRRSGGLALVLLLPLFLAVLAPGSTARATPAGANQLATGPQAAAAKPKKPHQPKPKPGWFIERARIEPLDARGTMAIAGVGEYRGAIEIVPTGPGVAVVNDVGLEDYVKGLAEVPSSWPVEAQKAQAIAARTYALHELNLDPSVATAARGVGAQICATDACQVYAGVAKERRAETAGSFSAWATAVEQTNGEVVLFQNAPINAKYSSSNGGRSIAGGRPYLKVVDDPDDRHSPLHRWRSQILGTDVANALGLANGVILRLQRSGDMLAVDWQGPDGGTDRLTIHVGDFRARVNAAVPAPPGLPRPVPFPRFTPSAEPSTNTVLLDGGGWGHGIGMSQWGAYGKALRGMKAPDILAAYYGGLRPTKLNPARLPATIRVAVDLGRDAAELVPTGTRFRVLDQKGAPVAVATSGAWRFVPEGKGVRVLPPPGQDVAPAVEALALDPAAPTAQAPVTVRFRLTTPAVVHMTMVDELGQPMGTVEPQLRDPGELTQALPPATKPGRYTVTIAADAGGGRTAAVPVSVDVRPAPDHAAAGQPGTGRPGRRHALGPATSTASTSTNATGPTGRIPAGSLAATLLISVAALAARKWRSTGPTTLKRP